MTINCQSGPGKIRLFEDFFSHVDNTDVADNTTVADQHQIGPFRVFGADQIEVDCGVLMIGSDELSGVGRLTTTDEDNHCCLVGTGLCFDVALMGPIVVEARVRFNNLDTKDAFIGLTDEVAVDDEIEGTIMKGATTTLTLTASDLVGFYLSSELTDDEDWHAVYNGGSTTGETNSENVDLDDDAVAGEWQVLRLEVDPNGTARWYIDGVLLKTLEGAVSTTTDLGVVCGVGAKGNAVEEMDIDYLLVEANRDWNA